MMQRYTQFKKNLFPLFLFAVAMFFLQTHMPLAQAADESASSGTISAGENSSDDSKAITLNMVDVDVSSLIRTMSLVTGKTFVIDSSVKGKINVVSDQSIPADKAYSVFESILENYGFALVPAGNLIKVVPAADAVRKNIETRVESGNLTVDNSPEDKLITLIITLKYVGAKNAKTLLTPLAAKTAVMTAYEETNTLILLDTESNIQHLKSILKEIDVPGSGRGITVRPLLYADAETLTQQLSTLFKTSMSEEKEASQSTQLFVSDDRTNSIIFVASEEDSARIEYLIQLLDVDIPKGKGNIKVYYLKNANAEDMATTLQDLIQGATTSSSKDDSKDAVFSSSDINITADTDTNSLLIMADGADHSVLEGIIEQLDIPRNMVYIEALIMQVNEDKAFELGVEWSAFGTTDVDGESTIVGGSFSSSGYFDPTDLIYTTGATLGIVSTEGTELTTSAGTVEIPSLGALIKAIKTNEDVTILSKPNVVTQDNKEATIFSGKNVAYQTTTSTSDNDTYNSYDYKDVGITLKITPHISQNRNVRLDLYVNQEAMVVASTDDSDRPTTLKREVTTTVNIKDRELLVIGGLIDDTVSNSVMKIPLLGSIPILGRLFRYDSKSDSKTNLYIFITPRVIQDADEAIALTDEIKYSMPEFETGRVSLYTPMDSDEDSTLNESTVSEE
jgi:general secretion pathway protein D